MGLIIVPLMQKDLIQVDPKFLAKWNRAVPRYTSYPTAPQFHPIGEEILCEKLEKFTLSQRPLSLYFHIPFCKTMCLFCGCSVVLNRKPERQEEYFSHLLLEIERVAKHFHIKRKVNQLHLGGGTPTSLTEDQFILLMQTVHSHFELVPEAEISIEIDPRTVFQEGGKKLSLLKTLGFNRISFGVQDLDPIVQKAIRRYQSEEMTISTYEKARELGFEGINIDLIYGLPFQTAEQFAKTAEKMVALKPDRIAFYSYAKIPWLKEHQKAIREQDLPTVEEKFKIYVEARARFMQGGYAAIGMDHFALFSDSMAKAYQEKRLTRNFQGYSVSLAEDMIGFGMTAIGFIENSYFQNSKTLEEYQTSLQKGSLPVAKGYLLKEEDQLRHQIIQKLMCHFEIDQKYRHLASLDPFFSEGFLEERGDQIVATALGRLFIRLIASAFDAYLNVGHFSRAV